MDIEQRTLRHAALMISLQTTVRGVAEFTGWSKTTVHVDLTERLPHINKLAAVQVYAILSYNDSQKAIRGGRATKRHWEGQNQK